MTIQEFTNLVNETKSQSNLSFHSLANYLIKDLAEEVYTESTDEDEPTICKIYRLDDGFIATIDNIHEDFSWFCGEFEVGKNYIKNMLQLLK